MAGKPVILLVPGAFTSPKAFAKLTPILESKGYETAIAPLTVASDLKPTSGPDSAEWQNLSKQSMYDDAKSIQQLLESYFKQGREVLVAGHSYGSIPAMTSCEAIRRQREKLKG